MRTTGNFLVATAQIAYLLLTPWWAWWYFGGLGLVGWIAFSGVWMGATVVIWSGYQRWRAEKCTTHAFLSRVLLSPLLGAAWTVSVGILVVHFAVHSLVNMGGASRVRGNVESLSGEPSV